MARKPVAHLRVVSELLFCPTCTEITPHAPQHCGTCEFMAVVQGTCTSNCRALWRPLCTRCYPPTRS